jgi:hypothetical protein
MTAFTPDDLAALERPVRRRRIGKRVAAQPSERTIQRGIVKALRAMGIMVHHSPNASQLGGDRFARVKQAAVLKADGMMAGWPDLTLIDRDGEVAFLEIKAPGGVLEPSQEALLPKMRARRARVAVVMSLDEALAELKRWGWVQ